MASNSKVSSRKSAAINNVDDVVFRGIATVVDQEVESAWVGTMSNLTSALNRVLSKKQRTTLPRSPGALRIVINRVVNRLRNRGIGVKFGRTSDHMRTRFVRFAH
jgi:uncharacterized protein